MHKNDTRSLHESIWSKILNNFPPFNHDSQSSKPDVVYFSKWDIIIMILHINWRKVHNIIIYTRWCNDVNVDGEIKPLGVFLHQDTCMGNTPPQWSCSSLSIQLTLVIINAVIHIYCKTGCFHCHLNFAIIYSQLALNHEYFIALISMQVKVHCVMI